MQSRAVQPGPAARVAGILVLALAFLPACRPGPVAPGPNLLLVTVDTLRADRLACYGGTPGVGQAICSLAEPGVRYELALSAAPSTAPAITSMLTSRHPSSHGVTQFATTTLPDEAITLAEVLTGAGYATAAFVSNPVLAPGRRLDQGFSVYDAELTRAEGQRRDYYERDARETTTAALAWLSDAREPWFLWVHYQDPHGPYAPPDAPPARDAAGVTRLPLLTDHSGRGGLPAYQFQRGALGIETYAARYTDEIRFLDGQLGRLLAGADAADRPVGVLLTADHGEAMGEDGYWFAHGHSVGLDQIRVPLLWRAPGATRSVRVPGAVTTLDVAPTLLVAAGAAPPTAFQGRPLGDAAPARALFAEHRMRVAVSLGGLYLERDRASLTAPAPDRITGGWLYPMEPRLTDLAEGSAASSSTLAGELESLLDSYLAAADGGGGPETAPLSEEARRALESLGYLE